MVSIDLESKEAIPVLCLFLIQASKRWNNSFFRLEGMHSYTLDPVDPRNLTEVTGPWIFLDF